MTAKRRPVSCPPTSLPGRLVPFILCVFVSACGSDTDLPERMDPDPVELAPSDAPITLTPQNYASLPQDSGLTPIGALRQTMEALDTEYFEFQKEMFGTRARELSVWQTYRPGLEFPVPMDCEPERDGIQRVANSEQLPVTIEGVVTLHPRYFVKTAMCGSDQRFYGSFTLQDATGGILVLRDSRISEFSFGDRVRLRVNGVSRNFDTYAVLSFENLEVLTTPQTRQPIYYKPTAEGFKVEDKGQVMQVTGYVFDPASNDNFNTMILYNTPDPARATVQWIVSLDRELGQRNPDLRAGQRVQVTGPLIESFGLKLLVSSYGQLDLNPPAPSN